MRLTCSRAAGTAGVALAALGGHPPGRRARARSWRPPDRGAAGARRRRQRAQAPRRRVQPRRPHGTGTVTLRLLHRDRTPRVLGHVTLRVRAHATRRFGVAVRVPALAKGSYQLAACAPRGIGGNLTCATGAHELQVAGGDAIRGTVAAKQAAPPANGGHTCSSGTHTLAPFGDHVYPRAATAATRASTPTPTWSTTRRRTSSCPATTSPDDPGDAVPDRLQLRLRAKDPPTRRPERGGQTVARRR